MNAKRILAAICAVLCAASEGTAMGSPLQLFQGSKVYTAHYNPNPAPGESVINLTNKATGETKNVNPAWLAQAMAPDPNQNAFLGNSPDQLAAIGRVASIFAAGEGGDLFSSPETAAPTAPITEAPIQVAQAAPITTDVSSGLFNADALDASLATGAAPPAPTTLLPDGTAAYGPPSVAGAPAQTDNNGTQPATNPDGTPATTQPATAPKPESTIADKFKTAAQAAAGAGAIKGLISPRTPAPNGQAAANQLAETEQQRQARITAATDSVNKAFAGYDDPYYQSVADAYRNFQMPLYNEQVTEARRTLPMSVPNTQSSAYERRARQLETDVQRGQSDLESQAFQQANARRGEIDMQKSDLLNMATAGADASTVADAAGQRAQMYAAPPQFSPIADMFQKYSADAANFALANNANSGAVMPSRPITPLSFSRSPSSSQRIVA